MEIVAINIGRYKTEVCICDIKDGTIHIEKELIYGYESILDYIINCQDEKLSEFFVRIKDELKLGEAPIYLSIPDSIVRIDCRETTHEKPEFWKEKFKTALMDSIPVLAEEPHCFDWAMVKPHPKNSELCFLTAVSVKRRYVATLDNALKVAKFNYQSFEPASIAIARYLFDIVNPYLVLSVEHDRLTVSISFGPIGIDLVGADFGWDVILAGEFGIMKLLGILSPIDGRIRTRHLSNDEPPIYVFSEKAEEISEILQSKYEGRCLKINKCYPKIVTDIPARKQSDIAIFAGLALKIIAERRNTQYEDNRVEATSKLQFNSIRGIRGKGVLALEKICNRLPPFVRRVFGYRPHL